MVVLPPPLAGLTLSQSVALLTALQVQLFDDAVRLKEPVPPLELTLAELGESA